MTSVMSLIWIIFLLCTFHTPPHWIDNLGAIVQHCPQLLPTVVKRKNSMLLYLFYKALSYSKKPWGGRVARTTRVDPSDGDMAEEGSFTSFNSSSQFSEFKGPALIHFAGVSIWRFPPFGTHQCCFLN